MNNRGIEIEDAGPGFKLVSILPNKNMFYGYPYGAAMDFKSASEANAILGLAEDKMLIECSLKGCKLIFHDDLTICISGADMSWELDDQMIEKRTRVKVKQGQRLSAGFSKHGLRAYIAFSKSIQRVDNHTIEFEEKSIELKESKKVNTEFVLNSNLEIRKGPEWNLLDDLSKERLKVYQSKISKDFSRMGIYLIGEELKLNQSFPKQSVCTFPGVIQLLPNGQLLVLAQDAQTTGGYPRIAYLDRENLCDFNQLGIGQKINWRIT